MNRSVLHMIFAFFLLLSGGFFWASTPVMQSFASDILLTIENQDPVIERIRITPAHDSEAFNVSPLLLSPGGISSYLVRAQISDANGIGDIVIADMVFYQSNGVNKPTCEEDNYTCFHASLDDGSCWIEPISLKKGVVYCALDLPSRTPASGEVNDGLWRVSLAMQDFAGGSVLDVSYKNRVATNKAIQVLNNVRYERQSDGSMSAMIDIENKGNVPIRVGISATDLTCESGIIPVNHQHLTHQGEGTVMLSHKIQVVPNLEIDAGDSERSGSATLFATIDVENVTVGGNCEGNLYVEAR